MKKSKIVGLIFVVAMGVTWSGTEFWPKPVAAENEPDKFVVVPAEKYETAEEVIEASGAEVAHQFPDRVLVVEGLGQAAEAEIEELGGEVFAEEVDLGEVSDVSLEVEVAAGAWNELLKGEENRDLPAEPIEGDALAVPDEEILAGVAENDLIRPAEAPYGAGFDDTSEYLAGKVSVAIILPESNGAIQVSTENWTEAQENKVLAEIQAAMNWWKARLPEANLSFVYNFYSGRIDTRARTGYEPISNSSYTGSPSGQELWIKQIMNKFGYGSGDIFVSTRSFLNDMIAADRSDWGIMFFVANSAADVDGMFTDGRFAYAYYGGPFAMMTYDNDNYGISNMDAVAAHEMGHLFYALDQYSSAAQTCTNKLGYLNVENQNSQYSAGGAGCASNVGSIMRGGITPYTNNQLDYYAKGQMGVWDADGDGILNVLDTFPKVTVSSRTGTSNYTFKGWARVNPEDNRNAYAQTLRTGETGNDISLNEIKDVQFRIDSGSWRPATAVDGAWNEAQEEFRFSTGSLSTGYHEAQIRAKNNVGNWGDIKVSIGENRSLIVTGAGRGGGPQARVFKGVDGSVYNNGFFAFDPNYRTGVNVAIGDVDGDGGDEIVAATGPGGPSEVRVFNLSGQQEGAGFYAYADTYRGGVKVATGDLDGDGREEIITGTEDGGGPHVRVFDRNGNPKLTAGFFAFVPHFRGGVNVGAIDMDGNGVDEILVGAGVGGGPQVMVFNTDGHPYLNFFAYADNVRTGVYATGSDLDGDKKEDIVAGAGNGGGPHVRVFGIGGEPKITPGFFAYAEDFRGGVQVATGDTDGDGMGEIVTGSGPTGGPHVRQFEPDGAWKGKDFFAYAEDFRGGVQVAVGEY